MYRKIKILSPIDRVSEALPLIRAGADEFYAGVLISKKNFSSVRVADQSKFNLPNMSQLVKLVKLLKKHKKKIYVTLNHPCLSKMDDEIINFNLKKLKESGVDGIIIGSLDLISKVKKQKLKPIASSYFEAKNEETVSFLRELGIKRVILDRQINLTDLNNITRKFPSMELETFVMASACRSLASACHNFSVLKKASAKKFVHMCDVDFSISSSKNGLSKNKGKEIAQKLKRPPNACGACALYYFQKFSITSVKLVGRGFSTERKVENTKYVKKAISILKKKVSLNTFFAEVEFLFQRTFGRKCFRKYCYYPHFFK